MRILVFLLLAALLPGMLNAAAIPDKLSLTDAVSMALGENPTLKESKVSYLNSESELRIANIKTTYTVGAETIVEDKPDEHGTAGSVYGSLSYADLLGTKATLEVAPYGLGSQRGSVGLVIRQPLVGGKGALSEKSDLVLGARNALAIRDKTLYRTRQAVTFDVISAYYRAVLAFERIKVQERAVAIAEKAYGDARKRLDARLVTGLEVSRAETNLAQTKDALNLQQQLAKGALDRLMIAVGLGIGQTPELIDGIPEAAPDPPDLGAAIKIALANRAELAEYDFRLLDQERSLAMANDQLRPRVDAVLGYRSQSRDAGAISGSLIDDGSLTAGFEVSIPLDKTTRVEERDTAFRDLQMLKELRAFRADQVVEEVRQAYRALQAAQTSFVIYSDNLKAAQHQLYLSQRMVEEGEGSNREVLDAQNALTRVESGMLSAKTDLYLARMDLLYAMGEDLSTVVLQ